MKLLMLCREPRLYSCQRLKAAAEQQGCRLDILDPNRFLLTLVQGEARLSYQLGEHFEPNRPAPFTVEGYRGVLPRFGSSSNEIGCQVLRHLEANGVATLNSAAAFALARDKWQSLQRLVAQRIAVPDTQLSGELFSLNSALATQHFPLVIKTLSGSQGVGVMLSESADSARSLLETLRAAKLATIQQHFIRESSGQDIRAFVIGDRVVAAMQRRSQNGEFRANIHRGGTACAVQLSDEAAQLAVRATQAIGLDVAGVDLIQAEHGLMVLEVNASPGLEMIETVSQTDIASQMIAHLKQKI